MPMTADGLAKLIEECGELVQVAGKKLAYFDTDEHPDGGPPLRDRLLEEMGDVMAAMDLVADNLGISRHAIARRADAKGKTFRAWHADPGNNQHGMRTP